MLASGDPMLHGIGASLARRVGPERLAVHPHPSAFALACARLGWPAAEVELVSAVGRRPRSVAARLLQPGRRIVVYVDRRRRRRRLARLVATAARTEPLRGPRTARRRRRADHRLDRRGVRCRRPTRCTPSRSRCRPAAARRCTRSSRPPRRRLRERRPADQAPRPRATLAALAPGARRSCCGTSAPARLDRDRVAAGRAQRAGRSAIEARAERAARIERNATRARRPGPLAVVPGAAPEALVDLEGRPDAVFVGGGVTAPGLLDACWEALRPGGRLVVNAVTLESRAAARRGADRPGRRPGPASRSPTPQPIGGFTGWRPQMPVVQWAATKP